MDEKTEQEVKLAINIEQKELSEFSEMSNELLNDIEKTKEELKVEEKVKLNLSFVHHKLKTIHGLIQNIIINISAHDDYEEEIKDDIRRILDAFMELKSEFFPSLENNIKVLNEKLGGNSAITKQMEQHFAKYSRIFNKLEEIFDVEHIDDSIIRNVKSKHISIKSS